MTKISGVIICRDEEKNIEDCIKSILWCNEVIVIDSFSNDNTLTIVKKYTGKIFQKEWKGFAEQRKFSLAQVNYEWVLSLDADERCSEELSLEIKSLLSQDIIVHNGFDIPRKNFFLNKWLKHGGWYPNYQMRLFRKEFAGVTGRLVHEQYEVSGETGKLHNHIIHYTVRSVSEFLIKINNYSDLSALEKINQKKITYFNIFVYPMIAFIQQFILKGGFLDGTEGLMAARLHWITKTLNYMKIWEKQNKVKNLNENSDERI